MQGVHPRYCKASLSNSLSICVFGPPKREACLRNGRGNMHRVLKLAVAVFVGAVTGAGATCQPAAAASNSGLQMAQYGSGCPDCDMFYQQSIGQCEAFRMYGDQQYRACIIVAQQNVGRCMQACGGRMGGNGYSPGPVYPYPPGENVPLCRQYPNNPACR